MNSLTKHGRRRRGVLVAAAVLVVLVGVALTLGRSEPDALGRAPTFRASDIRDPAKTITLTSLRGKPVVINFWATWCVPCRTEMPAFQSVHHALGDQVTFLGINNRDSRRLAITFLHNTGVTYPSAFDPDGQIAAGYAVLGMPTTIFVSAEGTIAGRYTGQLSASGLRADISRYFHLQAQ